jgi:hypothetical protein
MYKNKSSDTDPIGSENTLELKSLNIIQIFYFVSLQIIQNIFQNKKKYEKYDTGTGTAITHFFGHQTQIRLDKAYFRLKFRPVRESTCLLPNCIFRKYNSLSNTFQSHANLSDVGSIPLTSGSGSGRPKSMWIRWILIRNTGFHSSTESKDKGFSTLPSHPQFPWSPW